MRWALFCVLVATAAARRPERFGAPRLSRTARRAVAATATAGCDGSLVAECGWFGGSNEGKNDKTGKDDSGEDSAKGRKWWPKEVKLPQPKLPEIKLPRMPEMSLPGRGGGGGVRGLFGRNESSAGAADGMRRPSDALRSRSPPDVQPAPAPRAVAVTSPGETTPPNPSRAHSVPGVTQVSNVVFGRVGSVVVGLGLGMARGDRFHDHPLQPPIHPPTHPLTHAPPIHHPPIHRPPTAHPYHHVPRPSSAA